MAKAKVKAKAKAREIVSDAKLVAEKERSELSRESARIDQWEKDIKKQEQSVADERAVLSAKREDVDALKKEVSQAAEKHREALEKVSGLSQEEAKNIMLSSVNLLKPASGEPIMGPTHDMVLGCYFMSHIKTGLKGEGKIFGDPEEAILAYHLGIIKLRAKIKVRIKKDLR